MKYPNFSTPRPLTTFAALLVVLHVAFADALHAAEDDTAFFEAKVLPLLQKRCYECHSHEKKIKGGLALDSRSGWEHGGDNGPAIAPGDLEKSLLIKAVRYTDSDLQMPTKGKLPAEEIAILEQWVKQRAADPRVAAAAGKKRVIDVEEGRKFWAFQPVADPALPSVKDAPSPMRIPTLGCDAFRSISRGCRRRRRRSQGSRRTLRRMLGEKSWTACSARARSASAGRDTGSISRATPT
jgi:hypothetical protein